MLTVSFVKSENFKFFDLENGCFSKVGYQTTQTRKNPPFYAIVEWGNT